MGGVVDPVAITRDRHGTPHVRAASEPDLWFALGFVHGQDRWFQADLNRHLVWGELAAWLGEGAVDLDTFFRTLDLQDRARELVAQQPDAVQAMLDSYAAGMNAGRETLAADPVELRLLGVSPEPWEAHDAYAILFLQSWALSKNLTAELGAWALRHEAGAALLDDLFRLDPRMPAVDPWWDEVRTWDVGRATAAFQAFTDTLGGDPTEGEASNNWVVGPSRSATGAPILANDPHLVQGVPSLWYPVDLAAGDDLHVAGATLPGLPGVVIGHNHHLAWGLTNVMADVVDVALLDRMGEGVRLARREVAFERERVTIAVKDGEPVSREVLRTPLGPVISDPEAPTVMVLRWHATTVDDRMPTLLHGLARVHTVADALPLTATPGVVAQNMVLADTTGDLAWQGLGSVPVRKGFTGRVPYPASDLRSRWGGWIPRLPGERAPARGYVHTANARLPSDTPADDPDAAPIPVDRISADWVPPHRHRRLDEVLSARSDWTPDAVRALQTDRLDVVPRDRLPELLEGVTPSTAQAARCHDLLVAWDHVARPDDVGPSVWAAFSEHLIAGAVGTALSEEAVEVYLRVASPSRSLLHHHALSTRWLTDRPAQVDAALDGACTALSEAFGADPAGWTWGVVHPLRLTHPFARGRRLLSRWNRPEVGIGGTGSTVAAAGHGFGAGERPVRGMASLRFVVDLADPSSATLVHPGGASGHPRHPDADSHFDTFVSDRTVPLWTDDADVAAHAASVLRLVPGARTP